MKTGNTVVPQPHVFLVTLCGILLWGTVQSVMATELTVNIIGGPRAGLLVFQLFDSDDTFDGFRTPFKQFAFPVSSGGKPYVLKDLPPGTCALLVYHDENENSRLDRNFIGIPKEPVGFSNDYRPKGPPRFQSAAFSITNESVMDCDVHLARPLGRLGRVAVGIGVISRSSPYQGTSGGTIQFIPAITYIGDRVQIFGPYAQVALVGTGDVRLAGTLTYRMGRYEADDSAALAGLDDRDETLMGGLAMEWELASGIDLSLEYNHDLLDRISGDESHMSLRRPFTLGKFRISPSAAINWQSSALATHDFGVSTSETTTERPAYRIADTFSFEAGIGLSFELSENGMAMLSVSVEQLDNDVVRSPIVSDDYVLKGFAAVSILL